ncbi:cytochrome c oxidase assembly protein [Spongiactinospora gelatinilytica]|uniref:Cytochrome c oxidase assembly protein n=1 Tax=Spongiactinospora gelatinilytica TaxID=2666298 RepID=A0A2W2HKQ1_9ACTN|nr:cytochrome c oxidase assembly protein [Spongiactinospora gelatinilytica]PZG55659.1 cytochrome c oxidase assembly protein [Spongiactinospora gelatinilytica]
MTHPPHEHGPGPAGGGADQLPALLPVLLPVLAVGAAVAAALVYLAAAGRLRRRGDAWPHRRDAYFAIGGAALAAAVIAPPPGGAFTAHMAQHLLAGMIAPLLLVCARPLTLALRVLRPSRPRRVLLTVAHSRAATVLMFAPVAAVLDMGGLWALYRTPLLAATHHQPLLHALVHLHVVAAGVLFTAAICQLDPVRRRWSLWLRGSTLLVAGAAHAILAKTLYTAPPPGTGFAVADLQAGAQLMYYGGDLVELALAAVLAYQWYTATGRAHARLHRRHAARPATAGQAIGGWPWRPRSVRRDTHGHLPTPAAQSSGGLHGSGSRQPVTDHRTAP